jgi:glycerophosphoryl diester phosphodiesterase
MKAVCCVAATLLYALVGCGSDGEAASRAAPAKTVVRQHIAQLAPAAVFAHRGQGPTGAGNPFPENSLAAFRAGIAQGTDGLEMDSELTEDGQLVLMHDDTVDRTSECRGCVSALGFDTIRHCRLLDGNGQPTDQVPPTLDEVFQLQPADILVNVELKVFGSACQRPGHGPSDLAAAMVATLRRLGVERRTLVQSFDPAALRSVRATSPPPSTFTPMPFNPAARFRSSPCRRPCCAAHRMPGCRSSCGPWTTPRRSTRSSTTASTASSATTRHW